MIRPNILLIVLDATRVDHCSCYSQAQSLTPALDALAAEGLLFERAFACAPWTLPAVSSILTGLYPTQTAIEAKRVLESTYRTLPALLKGLGYSTFAISKNSWFSSEFGLSRDFDHFHKLWQLLQTETDLTEVNLTQAYPGQNLAVSAAKGALRGNWLKNTVNLASRRVKLFGAFDYGARHTLRPVRQWISAQQGAWFALVHYLEAHLEYKPPIEWAQRFTDNWPLAQKLLKSDQVRLCYRHITGVEPLLAEELRVWRQLYAAEVAYQDYAMEQLLEWLKTSGHYDNTFIIVVADHGECLGEHSLLNHLYCLYDPLIHVPLVIRSPGGGRGEKVASLVQTNDIFGTVLAAAGAPVPETARDLLSPGTARNYVVAEYGPPRTPHPELLARFSLQASDFAPFMRRLVAVRTEKNKLITGSDGTLELYDLVTDPGEQINLAAETPGIVAELQGVLSEWRTTVGLTPVQQNSSVTPPALASEVAARLKALGYLD